MECSFQSCKATCQSSIGEYSFESTAVKYILSEKRFIDMVDGGCLFQEIRHMGGQKPRPGSVLINRYCSVALLGSYTLPSRDEAREGTVSLQLLSIFGLLTHND